MKTTSHNEKCDPHSVLLVLLMCLIEVGLRAAFKAHKCQAHVTVLIKAFIGSSDTTLQVQLIEMCALGSADRSRVISSSTFSTVFPYLTSFSIFLSLSDTPAITLFPVKSIKTYLHSHTHKAHQSLHTPL